MDPLDDLPKRHKNHVIESKAEAAFQNLLSTSEDFLLQVSDRKDYGTDCQIEVVDHGCATNVRIHVQLKGTEEAGNVDGSVSVEIRRSNLNYLLMQPHSFFVCYHVPTNKLLFCYVDAVLQKYDHGGKNWARQQTLTVSFTELLTASRLKSLATLTRSGVVASRDARIRQTIARVEDLPRIAKALRADLHVPEDEVQAAAMLSSLYDSGAEDVISAAFEKFESVLGQDNDAMIFCYMAEINLGMAGRSSNFSRIQEGISCLISKISTNRFDVGNLRYSIGNGFSALGREEDAASEYEVALQHLTSSGETTLLAECYMNLGSSYGKLGDGDKAAEFIREALRHNSQLPEGHFALGLHFHRRGEYGLALEHFDQVVFAEQTLGKKSSVSGWRINILFNLGDGKAAFRELNMLLSDASNEVWIWPWCSKQVASFGRLSTENAKLSIPFWDRYLKSHPNCPEGVRERLLIHLYLQSEGDVEGLTYIEFKAEFEASIQNVSDEAGAYLWDRLGHWAQKDDNWEEAERCFRMAHNLAGGQYGYCLGTALNFLDRPDESLPILLLQAEEIQPDDMSWFQVAVAYEKLGRVCESIDAYMKVIALNPNYEAAWFNLGGVYWNEGESEKASRVWKEAVYKFPEHELAALLHRDLPFIFQ